MKLIEPISIWNEGTLKTAQVLNAEGIEIQLNTKAIFRYRLYELNENKLGEEISMGLLYMLPEEYQQWETDEFAWDFIANKLNLTIVGDYVPPVIETENNEVNNS